jgi:eukaryotic-like serine/threonine-protein kinase
VAPERPKADDLTRVAPRDPFLGAILDRRFRIEEKLAAGGFGVVYRATHVKSSYEVALKVLHPAMSQDPRVVARFRREGQTLTALRSPHTVTTYELVDDGDGTLFMVMELLRGETLLQRFKTEGPLPWKRVVAIARAVCDSLAEAHGAGIVHRDLKPENIHLEPHGDDHDFVKVLDFGIAKLLQGGDNEAGGEELTKHNEVVGTFDYVSPEQIIGGSYSGRSDIYTLGVVMYEMITGSRPFGHVTGPALLTSILTTPPSAPSACLPGLPPDLDRVILRCLEAKPEARYRDVGELVSALDMLLAGGHDEMLTANLRLPEHRTPSPSDSETWHAEPPVVAPPYKTPGAFDAPRAPTETASPPPAARFGSTTLPGVKMPPVLAATPSPPPIPPSWHQPQPPIYSPAAEDRRRAQPPPPLPVQPRASSQMLPSYDVASAIARDQWARRMVWLVVLVLASIIGISLAFIF